MAGLCGLLLAMSLISEQKLVAQQLLTSDTETAELRRRVKELEERLEKLEARKSEESAATPVASVAADASVSAEVKTTPTAQPEGAKSEDEGFLEFFRKVEVSGFVDGYYSYNFNKPAGRTNVLRNFDTKNNQFALNMAEIVFEKKPDPNNSRLGFRLDLDFGPATDLVHASEPGGREVYKVIQQAYGSYLAPVGSGLQFDFGKFVTMHGAEVIETKDNWNYSRGLLFAWAIPYTTWGCAPTTPSTTRSR